MRSGDAGAAPEVSPHEMSDTELFRKKFVNLSGSIQYETGEFAIGINLTETRHATVKK